MKILVTFLKIVESGLRNDWTSVTYNWCEPATLDSSQIISLIVHIECVQSSISILIMVCIILDCLVLVISAISSCQAVSWMGIDSALSLCLLILQSLLLDKDLALITYCLLLMETILLRVLVWVVIWGGGSSLFGIWTICTPNHHWLRLSFWTIYLAISAFITPETTTSGVLTLFDVFGHNIINRSLVIN